MAGLEGSVLVDHSTFADFALEEVVRGALDRPRGELSGEELLGLEELEGVQKGIVDLSGIERLENLRWLVLGGNRVVEVAPLAGLVRLQFLDLSDNEIADISPLAGLRSLRALDLSGNRLEDISPLAELRQLTHLNLDDNGIADIAPLAELRRLVVLDAEENAIADFSPLFGLRLLDRVELSGNPLADRDQIKGLELRGMEVHFYIPYDELSAPFDPTLEEGVRRVLGGQKGLLTDEVLARVRSLNVTGSFKTLSGLERLVNLEELFLRFEGSDDLAIPKDLSPLAGLTRLRELTVRDARVSDLSPLGRLTRLEELNLPGNLIEDLSPLAELHQLTVLNFAENQVIDLTPLSGLHQVTTLNMTYNQVSDLSPLLPMQGLRSIWVRGNPLGETAREQAQALRDRGAFVVGL